MNTDRTLYGKSRSEYIQLLEQLKNANPNQPTLGIAGQAMIKLMEMHPEFMNHPDMLQRIIVEDLQNTDRVLSRNFIAPHHT